MTAKNTVVIGVLGETPYSEMCGDVNIPYCQNKSFSQGCSYFPNSYLPELQKELLQNLSFSNTRLWTNLKYLLQVLQ